MGWKGPELKLGVEKSVVEMSFNHLDKFVNIKLLITDVGSINIVSYSSHGFTNSLLQTSNFHYLVLNDQNDSFSYINGYFILLPDQNDSFSHINDYLILLPDPTPERHTMMQEGLPRPPATRIWIRTCGRAFITSCK